MADAEKRFGLKRTRITDILRGTKWDYLRSSAREPAVLAAYNLMEDDRAFGDDERLPVRQSFARILEEVTELAQFEKMGEAMQEELAAEAAIDEFVESGE